MPRHRHPLRPAVAAVLAGAALVALAASAPAQYLDPEEAPPSRDVGDGEVRTTPYHYSSDEGHFQVTWPAGCGELRIRAMEPDVWADEDMPDVVIVRQVICERFGNKGEGCSVTASFNVPNAEGGPAGPPEVLRRIHVLLRNFGVKIVRQAPVRREFPDGLVVEGIEVFGTGADGQGEFRVRGILSYHDIYVQSAWSAEGEVWENPAFVEFFDSFLPFAE